MTCDDYQLVLLAVDYIFLFYLCAITDIVATDVRKSSLHYSVIWIIPVNFILYFLKETSFPEGVKKGQTTQAVATVAAAAIVISAQMVLTAAAAVMDWG